MRQKITLSYAFNMSLGFTPAIIAIVLCGFLPYDMSIYIGTVFGLVYSIFINTLQPNRVPNLILYLSTAAMAVFSLLTCMPRSHVTSETFPITFETSILILLLVLFLQRKKMVDYLRSKQERILCQSFESMFICTRVALVLGLIHVVVIVMALLFNKDPMRKDIFHAIFHTIPLIIFIICIIFNQIGLLYFNKEASGAIVLPIVNKRGDVVGRSLASEALKNKNKHINPVVRVAITTNGMLFLCRRAQTRILDRGKMDVPLERYLRFGETLEECANQLVNSTFPNNKEYLKPAYSIAYHYENELTNRLNYLFILDIKDDIILCDRRFESGKLWMLSQIESNLGKDLFGTCLEEEFEHLKMVIETREKYKGS